MHLKCEIISSSGVQTLRLRKDVHSSETLDILNDITVFETLSEYTVRIYIYIS